MHLVFYICRRTPLLISNESKSQKTTHHTLKCIFEPIQSFSESAFFWTSQISFHRMDQILNIQSHSGWFETLTQTVLYQSLLFLSWLWTVKCILGPVCVMSSCECGHSTSPALFLGGVLFPWTWQSSVDKARSIKEEFAVKDWVTGLQAALNGCIVVQKNGSCYSSTVMAMVFESHVQHHLRPQCLIIHILLAMRCTFHVSAFTDGSCLLSKYTSVNANHIIQIHKQKNISITFNELYMFGFIMKPLCFPLLTHSIFTSLHLTYLLSSAPSVTQYLSRLSLILSLHHHPSSVTWGPFPSAWAEL